MKERKRITDAAISKMRHEIARGVERNQAIAKARKTGATLKAIGDAVGLTRRSGYGRFSAGHRKAARVLPLGGGSLPGPFY